MAAEEAGLVGLLRRLGSTLGVIPQPAAPDTSTTEASEAQTAAAAQATAAAQAAAATEAAAVAQTAAEAQAAAVAEAIAAAQTSAASEAVAVAQAAEQAQDAAVAQATTDATAAAQANAAQEATTAPEVAAAPETAAAPVTVDVVEMTPAPMSRKPSKRTQLLLGACAILVVIAGFAFAGGFLIGREETSPLLPPPPSQPPYPASQNELEWISARDAIIKPVEAVTFFPDGIDGGPGTLAVLDNITLAQMKGVPGCSQG